MVSSDASNTNANTFLNNISCGNELDISFGKSNTTTTKVLHGVIERIDVAEPNKNLMQITLSGPDWGNDVLKNRIVQYFKTQRKAADGISYDNTDTSSSIYNLYNNLLTITQAYPFNDITAAAQGIVVSSTNFDPATQNTLVPQLIANDEKLDDKLSELDTWQNLIHYVDSNKNIIVRPAVTQATSATWLFTDDPNDATATTWASGYVGFIAPNSTYSYTVENYKHRIIGLGGDQIAVDQQQTTNASSTNMDSNWIAMKFTPIQYRAYSIRLFIAKVGIPTVNFQMQLVQESGGKPIGTVVRTLSVAPSAVGSSGQWIEFNIGDEYQIGNNYWIVVPAVGTVSNTYKWYNDNGSSNTYSSSPDGITWTNHTSSLGYMFQDLYSAPLITSMPGTGLSGSDKVFHEEVYRKSFISDVINLNRYLSSVTALTNYKKEILKGRIYSPDQMIMPFQSVLVRKTQSGLQLTGSTNYYTLGSVDYVFNGGPSGATGEFYVDFQAVRFTQFP